jgi:hypothetical protein
MTAPTLLDLTAGADARSRLDDGLGLPGDHELAAIFERHCRQRAEVLEDRLREFEYAQWLATQCPICEEGGGGPECDTHVIEHEVLMKRVGDQ